MTVTQTNSQDFSIVANVTTADSALILHTVPNWLRVFNDRIAEVLIVIDEKPAEGRMALSRKQSPSIDELYIALEHLRSLDSRVSWIVLDYSQAKDTSLRWFGVSNVVRCQSGSPTFGYAYAVEHAVSDIVLRIDCDMVFYNAGWFERAIELLGSGELDLAEPPKIGMYIHGYQNTLSTGALMLKRSSFFTRCLPLKPHRLDWLRCIHRSLKGRPIWLSLEEILLREKERGRLTHSLLSSELGFSVHVYSRAYAKSPHLQYVISAIEAGNVPDEQLSCGWSLCLEAWPSRHTD